MARFETVRVNFNAPKELIEKIKEYSTQSGIPYTQCYVLLLQKGYEYQKQLDNFNFIVEYAKKQNINLSDNDIQK